MARGFQRASGDYLRYSSAIITAAPFTMSIWVYLDSLVAGNSTAFYIGRNGAGNAVTWYIDFESGVWNFFCSDANNWVAASGGSPVINRWTHLCGVAASASLRTLYVDGVKVGTNTTSRTPSGPNEVVIGAYDGGGGGNPFASTWGGNLAHAAIYNAALNDADVYGLGACRVSPLMMRPESLIGYWPLNGMNLPEPDLSGFNRPMEQGIGTFMSLTDPPLPTLPGIKQARFDYDAKAISGFIAAFALVQPAQAISINAAEVFTAAGALVQPAQTVAITANEIFTMAGGLVQPAQSISINVAEVFSAALAFVQAANTLNISAQEAFTAALALIQPAQSVTISAQEIFAASLALVQPNNTIAITGLAGFVASLSLVQPAQSIAINVLEVFRLSGALVQAANTIHITASTDVHMSAARVAISAASKFPVSLIHQKAYSLALSKAKKTGIDLTKE